MDQDRPIRVLVVDDHPAVRAGVAALIDAEPGLLAVEAVADTFGVAPAVHTHRPDVVVMDYQLPGIDGLSLCRELRRGVLPPAVLVYSAFADADMVIPAHVAGAGAIIDKGREPRELTLTIRRLAAGEDLLAEPSPELMAAAAHRLDADDLPILGMLVNQIDVRGIAEALGSTPAAVEDRIDGMLTRLVIGYHPV